MLLRKKEPKLLLLEIYFITTSAAPISAFVAIPIFLARTLNLILELDGLVFMMS